MSNNNNHNSSCAFAEQIVSYLYDEASVKEKTEFVAHLESCAGCTDELTAFGFVRSSILEWKNEEIFSLDMPALEIPNLHTAEASAASPSWLTGLRRLFSLSPKLAFGSVAFAALAIFVALSLVFFNNSNSRDVAGSIEKDSKNELAANKSQEEIVPKQIEELPVQDVNLPKEKSEQVKFQSLKISTAKSSGNSPRVLKNKAVIQKQNQMVAAANIENKKNKTNALEKQQVPKLYKSDEVEDESLRLADLFDEVGSR